MLSQLGNIKFMFSFNHHPHAKILSCAHFFILKGMEGVSKIKDGYNPATWMLEVTSSAKEMELGIDFAEVYRNSELYRYFQFYEILVAASRCLFCCTRLEEPVSSHKELCEACAPCLHCLEFEILPVVQHRSLLQAGHLEMRT